MSARRPSTQEQVETVNDWNRSVPIGCPVRVRLDDGSVKETITTAPASMLGGHTAVVWLKGISGCYLLSRCTAILE